MTMIELNRLFDEIKQLPEGMQQRVVTFTRTLSQTMPRGTSGRQLLQFAGAFSALDAQTIAAAIAEGCERVERDEW